MKLETRIVILAMLGMTTARPDAVKAVGGRTIVVPLRASAKFRREVPQEHSHEQFLTSVASSLNLNNVDNIDDPVFALLGNTAAAAGAGDVQDLDCLQQITADQAFTNAKANGNDIKAMADALIYRTLERNTASVGEASVLCTQTAKNPEIAALTQHQDPASPGAKAKNKQVALDLAVQLASIGADPQRALLSGTFAPGKIGDPTAAGNSCDDANDPIGCIETLNLRVDDATAQEITNAVANAGANNSNGGSCASTPTSSASPSPSPSPSAAPATNANANNQNAFTGSVGAAPIPILSSGNADRPFSVKGDTFVNFGGAAQRACDVQKNACANAFNSGEVQLANGVADCDAQQQKCVAANA